MDCPKCQFENREGVKFCEECGAKLELDCPACKAYIPPGRKFCGECGYNLIPAKKISEKKSETESLTFPPAAEKPSSDDIPIEGERKHVTVLFSDLTGYTAMSEKLDPEEVKEITSRIFSDISKIVANYDGFIEKYAGDAVMAIFGVPKVHEDDPIRAIKAAREIHQLVDSISPAVENKIGQSISMHTGINTGLVVTGEVNVARGTHGVAGDTINLASRLSNLAKPGEILIDGDTCRQAKAHFAFERLKPIKVKGKTHAISLFRVRAGKEKVRRRGIAIQGISSPLIGLDAEFMAIKGCMNRVLDGQGGILLVIGEAGLGKSRLMTEIQNHFSKEGRGTYLTRLEGRTLSYGQGISYWPFQEILRQYAGINEDDNDIEASQKFVSRITELFAADTNEILPYLASLLTLHQKKEYSTQVKNLDGEAMARHVFLSSRRFFERVSQNQPLVLVFEDLHWADKSSMLLLEHLLPLVSQVPLLICGISRTDPKIPATRLREAAIKDYETRYTEIHLTPLSKGEIAQLMRNLLEIENLPPRMVEMIVRKSEGNPFFLEEIMRSLIDRRGVERDPSTGQWRATSVIETITIPDTIQGVIAARVDRLDKELKQVLRSASVIGRRFLYRVLHAIEQTVQEMDGYLDALQAMELIREKQRIPEVEYIFKHALVQEVTYESILLQKRRELHAQVAHAIETLFSNRLEEFYSMLAHHYAQAEVWEKAQKYLLEAGDQAERVAADAEALAHYQQAIAAYAKAFGNEWDPLQRATLERKMGGAQSRRGEHMLACEHLKQALVYLGEPLPSSRWGVWLTLLYEIVAQIGHRLLPRLFCKQTDSSVSQAVEEETYIYQLLFWAIASSYPELSLLGSLKLLNLSERSVFLPGAVIGFSQLQLSADLLSLSRLADYYGHKAVSLAENIQHEGALGTAHSFMTLHENIQGRWSAVKEHARRAVEVYGTGSYWNRSGWAYAIMSLADCNIHEGEFTKALTYAHDLMQFGENSGDREYWSWGLSRQGFAQKGLGQFQESIDSLKGAMEFFKSGSNYQWYVDCGGELGQCYLRLGDVDQALALFGECQRISVEYNLMKSPTLTRFRNGLVEAYLLAAEHRDDTESGGWLKKAAKACRVALKQGKVYPPGLPEAMMLRGRYDWLRGKPIAAEKWWQRSLALAENMGVRYDLGRTLLEIGGRLGERAYIERAEAIFTEIGAQWDLAKAQEALK